MPCVLARCDEAWDGLRECGIAGKPTPTRPVGPARPAAVNAASRAADAGPGTAHRRRTLWTGVIRPSTPPCPPSVAATFIPLELNSGRIGGPASDRAAILRPSGPGGCRPDPGRRGG